MSGILCLVTDRNGGAEAEEVGLAGWVGYKKKERNYPMLGSMCFTGGVGRQRVVTHQVTQDRFCHAYWNLHKMHHANYSAPLWCA